MLNIDKGIIFYFTGKESNLVALDKNNFKSFKWKILQEEMKFCNTKFDDRNDQYTIQFRVLTKKTTIDLRTDTNKYLRRHDIWMQSTKINYHLNNNLGFLYGMKEGIQNKEHYQEIINNGIDTFLEFAEISQLLQKELNKLDPKYKTYESFHVQLQYQEYIRIQGMKADSIVIQGRSLHYNLLQYVLDNIRDVINKPYKFILKSQLNKT